MIARSLSRRALVVAVSALLAGPASAQTYTWVGAASDNNWTSPTNFNPAGTPPLLPGTGNTVVFDGSAPVTRLATVLGQISGVDQSYDILGITVTNAQGTVTVARNTTNNLTIEGGGFNLLNATQNLTLTTPTVLGANQPWVVGAGRTLLFSGAVSSTAARTLTVNDGGSSVGTTGTVALGAANTFAGSNLTLRNGQLRLDNLSSLSGMTGGVVLSPFDSDNNSSTTDRAVLALNVAGTYASGPVTLNSPSAALRPTVRSTVSGTVTYPGTLTVPATSAGFAEVQAFASGSTYNQTGAVNITNGATGTVELRAFTGTTLNVSGGVNGSSFAGTLQLGAAGTGTGTLSTSGTAAVTLAAGATVRKVDANVAWGVTSTSSNPNVWGTTAVDAGTLRIGSANALPTAAAAVLGQGATTGILDLNGFNQTVGGLTTASDNAQVNPNGNQVGIGNLQAGPGVASALTYNRSGAAQNYDGVLVDSLVSTTGYTLGLTLAAGDLTLRAANTFTGATLVNGNSTLGLNTLTTGSFTNHGSIASSPTITLNGTNTGLRVSLLAGGLNFDTTTSQFKVADNQTLRGNGTVTGGVTVVPKATLQGGLPGNVSNPLIVTQGVTFRSGAVGSGGGQFVVDLNNTSTTGTQVGRVQVGGTLTFDTATNGQPVTLRLVNSGNLAFDQPYSYDVATATAYQANTGTVTSFTYGTDFTLSADLPGLTGFSGTPTLVATGAGNTLTLSFTPVPEPATVGLLAVAGLGAVRLARRRILAG